MTTQRVELPAWECADLLRSRSIGRICVIDHGYPVALPVNYQLVGTNDDLHFVVRTSPDSILGGYEGLASLELDEIALDPVTNTGTAWSVIARGNLRGMPGEHELPDPHPLIEADRERWITLQVSAITGRRFTARPDPDGETVIWQGEPPS